MEDFINEFMISNMTRSNGKTFAMLEGVRNSDCFVAFRNMEMAKFYDIPKERVIAPNNYNKLIGSSKAVILDHTVLEEMLQYKQQRIIELQRIVELPRVKEFITYSPKKKQ